LLAVRRRPMASSFQNCRKNGDEGNYVMLQDLFLIVDGLHWHDIDNAALAILSAHGKVGNGMLAMDALVLSGDGEGCSWKLCWWPSLKCHVFCAIAPARWCCVAGLV